MRALTLHVSQVSRLADGERPTDNPVFAPGPSPQTPAVSRQHPYLNSPPVTTVPYYYKEHACFTSICRVTDDGFIAGTTCGSKPCCFASPARLVEEIGYSSDSQQQLPDAEHSHRRQAQQ